MKKLFYMLVLPLVMLGIYSCKDDPVTPPPPIDPVILSDTMTLSLTDITHRSLSIKVSTTVNNPKSRVKLFRVNNSIETFLAEYPIEVKDTFLIDDNNGAGLELNTEYSYYALRVDSLGARKDTSNKVSGITLNATSHEYTWEEFIIGEFQSSLYDVWGTDENNVYATGTCILNDTAYGVLRWDGNSWKPEKKIGGQYTIYGFSETDIWSAGGGVWHYDGVEWIRVDSKTIGNQGFPLDSILFSNRTYTSLWGTSSSNLYFGSEKGKIIHWDGKKAKDIGVQGLLRFNDMWGISDHEIFAVTGIDLSFDKQQLFFYDGNSWQIIKEANTFASGDILQKPLLSVWGRNVKDIVLVGRRIYRRIDNQWIEEGYFNTIHKKVRGSNSNNIAVAGYRSTIYHYNGVDWAKIETSPRTDVDLYGVYVTENKIFAVGRNFTTAFIYIGTKK